MHVSRALDLKLTHTTLLLIPRKVPRSSSEFNDDVGQEGVGGCYGEVGGWLEGTQLERGCRGHCHQPRGVPRHSSTPCAATGSPLQCRCDRGEGAGCSDGSSATSICS
eukprot:5738595-Amphidinium_carterae.2